MSRRWWSLLLLLSFFLDELGLTPRDRGVDDVERVDGDVRQVERR
jgi:hypothetical protein